MSLKSKGHWNVPKEIKNNDILGYILNSRNIEDSKSFLHPLLENIPDSRNLFDSKWAAELIIESRK